MNNNVLCNAVLYNAAIYCSFFFIFVMNNESTTRFLIAWCCNLQRKMKIQLYADLQATRSCQRRGRACYAYRYFIPPLLTCLVRADFFLPMKKKHNKPKDFKLDTSKPENARCTCMEKGKITGTCLEKVCPTMKTINAVQVHGFKWKENGKIRKEFRGFGEGIEAFRKIFALMRKKK
jgi:hypothetical protein